MQPILLVEDNEDLREALSDLLRAEGYRVLEAATVNSAKAELGRLQERALVFLDLTLPPDGGEALLAWLDTTVPPSERAHRVILWTASAVARVDAARAASSVVAVLTKPSSIDEILDAIRGQFEAPRKEIA